MPAKKVSKKEAVPAPVVPTKISAPLTAKKEPGTGFVLLFKTAVHTTYRNSFYRTKDQFEQYIKAQAQAHHPVMTDKKWFVIDLINGTITPETNG